MKGPGLGLQILNSVSATQFCPQASSDTDNSLRETSAGYVGPFKTVGVQNGECDSQGDDQQQSSMKSGSLGVQTPYCNNGCSSKCDGTLVAKC